MSLFPIQNAQVNFGRIKKKNGSRKSLQQAYDYPIQAAERVNDVGAFLRLYIYGIKHRKAKNEEIAKMLVTRNINTSIWVIKNEHGRVMGGIELFFDLLRPKSIFINVIAVATKEQHGGLGRRLIEFTMRKARGMGKTQIYLQPENKCVRKFFEKCGFHADTTDYMKMDLTV